jgi:hypothetical protein
MRWIKAIIFIGIVILTGCSKKEDLQLVNAVDFYPLQTGKIFIYRLDSTVLGPLNQTLITRSYIAKDSVESKFVDANNDTTFRIFRFIRDTLQTQPYRYIATYIATKKNNTIEYTDNNLRFVNLVSPVKENMNWNGTVYINTISPSPFSYMNGWKFTYSRMNENFITRKGVISNTVTIEQADETLPNLPFNPNAYQEKSFAKEVYAKGIGLIYKEFLRWVYQPPAPGVTNTYYQEGSFGIKLNLIDYK